MRQRKITVRPSAAWYNDDIDREKWTEKTEIRKAMAQIKPGDRQRAIQETMSSRQFSYQESKGKLLLQCHTRK